MNVYVQIWPTLKWHALEKENHETDNEDAACPPLRQTTTACPDVTYLWVVS